MKKVNISDISGLTKTMKNLKLNEADIGILKTGRPKRDSYFEAHTFLNSSKLISSAHYSCDAEHHILSYCEDQG